jgi:hypothetical protein
VLDPGSWSKLDEKFLKKTLIHENAHIGAGLDDHFYLDYNKNSGFVLRPDEKGVVHPFIAEDAVKNPDSVAYGAEVLARNNAPHNPEEFRR